MSLQLKVNKLRAQALNLKRLDGMPLATRMRYLLHALPGEFFRTRIFGSMCLRLVEISLTAKCQCRCPHCYAENGLKNPDTKELGTAHVKSLLGDIKALGATEVIFTGGEPLLHNDLPELVECAHKHNLVARLITNGILLNEELVRQLKSAGLNWCSISIDSPDPETHDTFRGYPGCFAKAMESFRLLRKYKIPHSIITVARKELVHSGDLERIVELGRQIGATLVRFNFPVPVGRFQECSGQMLDLEAREKVREFLKTGFVTMEAPSERTKCTAAVTKISILPNGDVTPCVFIPLASGNIYQNDLKNIWKSMGRYLKEFRIKGQCPMCDPALRRKLEKLAGKPHRTQ